MRIARVIFGACALIVIALDVTLLACDDWLTAEEETYEEGLFTLTYPSNRNGRDTDEYGDSTTQCEITKGPAEILAITLTIASLLCGFFDGVILCLVQSDLVPSSWFKVAKLAAMLAGLFNFCGSGIYRWLKERDMKIDECAGKSLEAEFDWAQYLGYAAGATSILSSVSDYIQEKQKKQ